MGVEAEAAARERRLYPRFDCAVVGAGAGVAGVAVAVAAAEEDGGGAAGARAARASASERWFANVFWDWRILRTAGVTLPCVASDCQYYTLQSLNPPVCYQRLIPRQEVPRTRSRATCGRRIK